MPFCERSISDRGGSTLLKKTSPVLMSGFGDRDSDVQTGEAAASEMPD